MRPLARIPLVATAALMLFTSTASAQFGGSDVLGPEASPVVLDPVPRQRRGVTVFASCTVARRTGTTVWFGYNNPLAERRVALVGPSNTVAVTVAVDGGEPGPDHPVPARRRGPCLCGHGASRIVRHMDSHTGEHPWCQRCVVIGHEWSVDACVSLRCRCALGDTTDRRGPRSDDLGAAGEPAHQQRSPRAVVAEVLDQWRRQRLLRWRRPAPAEGAVGLRRILRAKPAVWSSLQVPPTKRWRLTG